MSREHNDANILAMGARITAREAAIEILETWLGRSSRRAGTPGGSTRSSRSIAREVRRRRMSKLADVDPEIAKALRAEAQRQHRTSS